MRSIGRRARLVELRALARWERRCERELRRWEPIVRAIQERAIAWNDERTMQLVRDGLRAFETIAQRSTGAAPFEWSRSSAAIDWRALRTLARSFAPLDALAQRALEPDAWGDVADWDEWNPDERWTG